MAVHMARRKELQSSEGMKIEFCRDLLFHSVFIVVIVSDGRTAKDVD